MHALLGALTAVLFVAGLASAADERTARPAQTQRMTECNAQAAEKHLAADARKQFMSECLKGAHEDGAKAAKEARPGKPADGERHSTQGEKMKACNQEASAKNLRGDERRQFMSGCLKAEKKS